MPKPKSQKQARLFGAIIGNGTGRASTARRNGFTKAKARASLRGGPFKRAYEISDGSGVRGHIVLNGKVWEFLPSDGGPGEPITGARTATDALNLLKLTKGA